MALLANLPDSSLSADSSVIHNGDTVLNSEIHSRLHNSASGIGAWQSANTVEPWIQADLLNEYHVGGVATQGRGGGLYEQWVTQYSVSFGLSEAQLAFVFDSSGGRRIFAANSERFQVVRNAFDAVRARIVRLHPTEWNEAPTMRWEVYGCITGKLNIRHIPYALV